MTDNTFPVSDGDVLYSSTINWVAGFGDGSDGEFNESIGTTNLTQGTIYQYTSFNLGASATLSASSTSEFPIIIYVQGDCTIDGTIDLVGKGCPTSFDAYKDSGITISFGTSSRYIAFGSRGGYGVVGGGSGSPGLYFGGSKGGKDWNFGNNQRGFIMNGTAGGGGMNGYNTRAGGGGGASSQTNGSNGEGTSESGTSGYGSGGSGGCTFFLVCGGNLTLGSSGTIDVSGEDGNDGSAGGGGGGGSGDILIFYKGTKTDNGITTTVNGGSKGLDTSDGTNDGGNGASGVTKIAKYNTIMW